jgi:D-beta-D-heptose 7-phosphate kinase/D-beta-D-heptose 1-phosphate adenosyltransferase
MIDGPLEERHMGRIVGMDDLLRERRLARDERKRFVFTNGCFDLLHRGHVELLKTAKGMGDVLCVGLNSDSSVRRLKGIRRPIVGQSDRAVVLASLEAVDLVVIFEEDTPGRVISELRPDVLVKGADYALEDIVGRKDVEEAGGAVVRVPVLGAFSTEALLREIARRYKDVVKPDS